MPEHRVSFQKNMVKLWATSFNHLNHMIILWKLHSGDGAFTHDEGSLKFSLAPPTLSKVLYRMQHNWNRVSLGLFFSQSKQCVTQEASRGLFSCFETACYPRFGNYEVKESQRLEGDSYLYVLLMLHWRAVWRQEWVEGWQRRFVCVSDRELVVRYR